VGKGFKQRPSQVSKSLFDESFIRIFASSKNYCDQHDMRLVDGECAHCEQAKNENETFYRGDEDENISY